MKITEARIRMFDALRCEIDDRIDRIKSIAGRAGISIRGNPRYETILYGDGIELEWEEYRRNCLVDNGTDHIPTRLMWESDDQVFAYFESCRKAFDDIKAAEKQKQEEADKLRRHAKFLKLQEEFKQ